MATPPLVGTLRVPNFLSEIAAAGSQAQATARANLAIPTSGGTSGSNNLIQLVLAPAANQVCQRDTRTGGTGGTGAGGIPITINLPAGCDELEWQLINYTTQAVVTSWTSLGPMRPGNQNLIGLISAPATLTLYQVQLRVNGDSTTIVQTTQPFTVGEVVAMWGQSGLNAFFQQRYAPNATIAGAVPGATPWGWAYIGFTDIAYPAVGNLAEDFENPAVWSVPSDANAYAYTGVGLAEFLRIMVARLGCPVGVVGYAYGGSSITSWQPGTANYNVLTSMIAAAGGKIGTLLKQQGSADFFSLSQSQYLADLQTMHGAIRARFGAAFQFGEILSDHPDVRADGTLGVPTDAQEDAITEASASYAAGAPHGGEYVTLVGIALITVDNVHETQLGAMQMAAHFARACCRTMGLETNGDDGPVLGNPTRAVGSAQVVVPVTPADGATVTLDATPSPLYNPYRVFDAVTSTELSVSSLSYAGGNLTITLTSAPPDADALTIRPFYGVESPTAWNQYLRDNYVMGVAGVTEGRHVKRIASLTVPAPNPGSGGGGSTGSSVFTGAANLLAWWSADNTTNNTASSIADKSGAGHAATQPTAANQPAVVAGALGGRQVLSFNGSTSYLIIDELASLLSGAPQNLHIFMVVRVNAATNYPTIIGFSTANDTAGANQNNQFFLWQVDNPGWSGGRYDQTSGNGNYQTVTTDAPDGATWRILEISQQANGLGGLAIDGNPPAFGAASATESLTFVLGAIGAWRYGGATPAQASFCAMEVAEVAIIGRYLQSGTERYNYLTGLNAWWGLGKTIPAEGGGTGSSTNSGAFTTTANLIAWWSANNSANTAGVIADMSGNGNTATQPTTGQQPTVVSNFLSGRNVLSFDGASNNLILDGLCSTVSGAPKDLHFFLLLRAAPSTVYPKIFGFSTAVDLNSSSWFNQFLLTQVDNPGWSGGRADTSTGNTNYQTVTTDAPDGSTWRIFEMVQHSDGTQSFALDGGAFVNSPTACTESLTFVMGTLGAWRYGSGPTAASIRDFCSMYFAEGALVARYVSNATERYNILQALNVYWGLEKTIPS